MNEEPETKGDDNKDPAPLKDVEAKRVPNAEKEKELQNEPPSEGGGAPGEAAQT